ncbi:cation diffusion facilitator family transporter [Pseudomonadota bacterium]
MIWSNSNIEDPQRYQSARKVTTIGLVVNVFLAMGQIALGIVGHSQALIADGIHTISDFFTDFMVLVAVSQGAKVADDDHPYGHWRIETAFTVVLGVALIAVGIGIASSAGVRLYSGEGLEIPSNFTLVMVITTILSKEAMYRYTLNVATRVQSQLLKANAWHHRSDAISSLIVLAGISGSIAGFIYLDAVAAIGVALMVTHIGWKLSWNATKELIDTGLDSEAIKLLRKTILSVDGVVALHELRTRRMAGVALVDVHIQVPDKISVSEGHHISETVRAKLIEEIDMVSDVLVHIDPEDDNVNPSSVGLPMRRELGPRLDQCFAQIDSARQIEDYTLHYLEGEIKLEVLLPVELARDKSERDDLFKQYQMAVRSDQTGLADIIKSISLRFI